MRIAVAAILFVVVLFVPAAAAHNRCECLQPVSGPPGTLVTITRGYAAYRIVWNGRGLPGHTSLNRLHRRNVRTVELLTLPRAKARSGARLRVPRVPAGVYPVVIYDGSEGGTHYVWEVFRVRCPLGVGRG